MLIHAFLCCAATLCAAAEVPAAPRADAFVLVTVAASELARAQDAVGAANLTPVEAIDPGVPLVRCLSRFAAAERLAREGFEVGALTTSVPVKYIIPGFRGRAGAPPREAEGRIDVHDGFHDGPMIEALLAAFAARYPAITALREIGKSVQGRRLLALKISGRAAVEEDEPAVLFAGGVHGSEVLGPELVLDIIAELTAGYAAGGDVRRWVDSCAIWCVPLVNPDGNHRYFHVSGAGRKNGADTNGNGADDRTDGVDLNRNFPFMWNALAERGSSADPAHGRYRGPRPASEPETRAVMALAEAQRFVIAFSFHTAGTKVLVPYTIDGVQSPSPHTAWMIAERIAALASLPEHGCNYKAVRNLYPVDGTDQDWLYHTHGTLAYIIEGPRTSIEAPGPPMPVVKGMRRGWRFALARLFEGPTLSGRVRDAGTGAPLAAELALAEITTYAGERHTAHPATGRFDLVLPAPGIYHLHVAKEGFEPRALAVQVGEERREVEVLLAADQLAE